jgi:hypothetical protein
VLGVVGEIKNIEKKEKKKRDEKVRGKRKYTRDLVW